MKNHVKHYLHSLKQIIRQMDKNPEQFVKRPGKDFTRIRKLRLKTIISAFLTNCGKCISNELL